MKRLSLLSLTALIVAATAPAFAAAPDNAEQDKYGDRLFGNLGGARDALAAHGADVDLVYNGTAWALGGGAKDGTAYEQLAEARVNVDGEKAFGIKGNSASISVQHGLGGHPNNFVGSVEAVDNLEENPNAFRLYEAYIQQTFLNDKLTALVGVRDLNADFVWTEASANFIKPTFQIGQDMAQSGENSPSIFPFTGLATTLKYAANDLYVIGGVFDGVPQDPDHPRSWRFDLNSDDGALLIAEGGYEANEGKNKLAAGIWSYTEESPKISNPAAHDRSDGAYILTSYQLYNNEAKGRDVTGFIRFGIANGDTMQTDWSYQAGLVGTGWICGRPEGEIGVGVTQAHNGDDYRTAAAPADNSEHGVEVYYRDQVTPAIAIQPDLQYVVNPGTDTVADDAYIAAVRLNVNF